LKTKKTLCMAVVVCMIMGAFFAQVSASGSEYIINQLGASNGTSTLISGEEVSGGGMWKVTSQSKDYNDANSLYSNDTAEGNSFVKFTPKAFGSGGLAPGYYTVEFYNPNNKSTGDDSMMKWEVVRSVVNRVDTHNASTLNSAVSYENISVADSGSSDYYLEDIDKKVIIKTDRNEDSNLVYNVSSGNRVSVRVVTTAARLPYISFQFSPDGDIWTEAEGQSNWSVIHQITGTRAARRIELDIPEGMEYFRIYLTKSDAPGYEYRISEIGLYDADAVDSETFSIDQRKYETSWVAISSKSFYFSGNGTDYIQFTRLNTLSNRYSRLGSLRFVPQEKFSPITLTYDDSLEPVTVPITEDSDVTAKVGLTGFSGDVALIAVVYDTVDRQVKQVRVKESPNAALNDEVSLSFNVKADANCVVKVYLWNSLNQISPLTSEVFVFGE